MENEKKTRSERLLTIGSKVISAVSVPFFLPLLVFVALFLFTYLGVMPVKYKLIVLAIVVSFTVFLPVLLIFLFLKINGSTVASLYSGKRRYVPYLLTIAPFIFCSLMMYRLNIPWYMNGIILSSIVIMVVFFILSLKWKISAHAGGMGAVVGGVVAFEYVLGYNPVWALCIFIVISGLVGSARLILGKHTLNEVLAGFTIGLVCTLLVLHPNGNFLYRLIF